MHEYDVVDMKRTDGSGVWECDANTVQELTLPEQEASTLDRFGYLIRVVSDDHVEIVVNRLDVVNLQHGTEVFYENYS